jgi:hypothetical protein
MGDSWMESFETAQSHREGALRTFCSLVLIPGTICILRKVRFTDYQVCCWLSDFILGPAMKRVSNSREIEL